MVSEIRFFKKMKKKKKKKMDNLWKLCLSVFHTSCDIFIHFLHAVTFSHVLHLDVLRRQIELKLKAKIEISLCVAILQNHPLPSLYTVLPYCVIGIAMGGPAL